MKRTAIGVSIVLVVVLAGIGVVTSQSPAVAACTASEPAPQVLSSVGEDIVFFHSHTVAHVRVLIRYDCAGGPGPECATVVDTSCTGYSLRMTRSGDVGPSARACAHTEGSGDGGGDAQATEDPRVYAFDLTALWALRAEDDRDQPAMTNACAGPWDVTARAYTQQWNPDGTSTTTTGPPVRTVGAFSLLRRARLTTDASPERVRRGAVVSVRGRLTRQVLAATPRALVPSSDLFTAFPSRRVLLQRRSLSGPYTTIGAIRSNARGYLLARVRQPSSDRCYRFLFRGTATTRAVTAQGDCVHTRSP